MKIVSTNDTIFNESCSTYKVLYVDETANLPVYNIRQFLRANSSGALVRLRDSSSLTISSTITLYNAVIG